MSQAHLFNKNLKDFNMNKVTKSYYVYAEEDIRAGDFVQFVEGVANGTTTEVQVKKATMTSGFDGIARTSGLGGTSTAHNQKVEVDVMGNLFNSANTSNSLAGLTIKMTNNKLSVTGTCTGNTGITNITSSMYLPKGNYRVYIKGAIPGTFEIRNKAGTIIAWGPTNTIYTISNNDINTLKWYTQTTGTYNNTVEFAIYRDDDIEDRNNDYYLESTGLQYIDTGFKHNQNTRVIMEFEVNYHQDWKCVVGSYGGTEGTGKFFFMGFNNAGSFYSHYGKEDIFSLSVASSGRHRLDFNKNILKIDDKSHTFSAQTFQSEYNFMLFGTSVYNGSVGKSSYKLYFCKVYDNDTLIRDFVPAINTNGKPCLFDRVSKTYFLNKGTGDFVFGYNQQPKRYLQSNGAQCIDTGIIPSSKTRMEITFNLTNTNKGGSVCGWGSSASQEAFLISPSIDTGFRTFISSSYNFKIAKSTLDTEIHTFDLQSGSQKFDGVEFATDTIGDTAVSGQTMYLFAQHSEWTTAIDGPCYINLYKCRIWENGILVRDFIPATTPNKVNCLYDRVSKRYFYNKGTGSFVIGNNAEYTPLKYIESTGTQYIDTEIIPKTGYTMETGFQASNTHTSTSESWVVGQWDNGYGFRIGINGGVFCNYYDGVEYSQQKLTEYTVGKGTCKQDQAGYSLTVFAQNESKGVTYIDRGDYKLYYLKIWDANGTLLRDFIPVLDKNKVACLFDNVSQNFFYNKGTGNFIAGKVTECNYLESTGIQYIDTGIIPNTSTTFEISAEATTPTIQEDACLFGSRTNYGTNEYVLWDCHYTENVSHICAFVTRNFGSTPRLTLTNKQNVFKYDGTAFYINSVKQLDKTNDMTTAQYSMYLFGMNQDGKLESRAYKGKVYYFKIWQNSKLIRHFVPVIDGNGVACLYDVVSQGFFYNKGSGSFLTNFDN